MITVTDLFCGAGGSSLGAAATGQVEISIAANHWATAIDGSSEMPRVTQRPLVHLPLEVPPLDVRIGLWTVSPAVLSLARS